jgi:hypothetical protein
MFAAAGYSLTAAGAVASAADIQIDNPALRRALRMRYTRVSGFRWDASPSPITRAEMLYANERSENAVLYVEELRVDGNGFIEHELRFLDGANLLISAGELSLNLQEYVGGN